MPKCQLPVFAVALVFSGCTMMPKYERPPAPVAAEYPVVSQTNESHAADISWQDFLPEDRLKKLIGLALTNNLDFRVAMLNVEQSRAQYRITRSASLPTMNGSGSFTRANANDRTVNEWSASLGTTAYEVDLFGRVRSLNRQALETYFATAEAQRSAQITLVAEVADEYFALREAEEQLRLAQQTLAAVHESYYLNQATFDAGASSELDLRTAESQVETAKINVLTYERQIVQVKNYLTLLIGEPLPSDLPAPRPFNDTNLVAEIPAGLPSELIQRRPDILEAEHTLKAANANIGAARAAFFPTITLTGSIGTTSSEFDKLFRAGTGVWSFSPQVTLPIFTSGQNLANLDAAKVSTRIEVANYQKATQTAFREVADALVASCSYAEEIKEQAALINSQQRRYDLANLRYRQGDDTYLNVLSAQQDLYSAQQGQIEAQYNKLASQISLYKALGGGWK
ncbi:MAG TPA: efflux transporter outer membrane subunit [Candidatus Acidoferrum sp.]|jgi:multidrug efflux system outer membrane protein|nr:efflux transporter outer membrane subunit [Candidatus Acidoferrum sp.]